MTRAGRTRPTILKAPSVRALLNRFAPVAPSDELTAEDVARAQVHDLAARGVKARVIGRGKDARVVQGRAALRRLAHLEQRDLTRRQAARNVDPIRDARTAGEAFLQYAAAADAAGLLDDDQRAHVERVAAELDRRRAASAPRPRSPLKAYADGIHAQRRARRKEDLAVDRAHARELGVRRLSRLARRGAAR